MKDSSAIIPQSVIYRWLAQYFLYPPTPADLERYRSHEGRVFLAVCASNCALGGVLNMIKSTLPQTSDGIAARESFSSAFRRAFDMGGAGSAPPYASVYLADGLLYQKPARDMNRLLGALRVVLPDEMKEPPDHLGIQLHVAAELADREAAGQFLSLSSTAFLESYILNWLPAFLGRCERLRNSAPVTTFVRGVADLVAQDAQAGRAVLDAM